MVVEHCAECGTTRKVYGEWRSLVLSGIVGTRLPKAVNFPRLGHDSINEIMFEIKNGGGKIMPSIPPIQSHPIPGTGEKEEPVIPVSPKKGKITRKRLPYNFMAKNKDAIIDDIISVGRKEAKKVWAVISDSTWGLYVGKLWAKDIIARAEKATETSCPCSEIIELRRFRNIICGGLVTLISLVKEEVKDGNKPINTERNSG
ncbi:MAG: hypothetical protein PHN44_01180 [Candidatus Marinimicrobia bacterium]|nr:hypothetical protein [Candidatus Neomarinimicrobiota bacterium]MDD5539094.1 hypothetical protein [Candidatus Neomarinimicrobiota bacterium]